MVYKDLKRKINKQGRGVDVAKCHKQFLFLYELWPFNYTRTDLQHTDNQNKHDKLEVRL